MFGNIGKFLFIDLSTGKSWDESADLSIYNEYLGGYGIGVKILMEKMRGKVDPLGPENILGFAAGPLTGTSALIGSRCMAFAKSPSTKGWGDANCGGYLGGKNKNSGFDAYFIKGVAKEPVYILVDSGRAKIFPAHSLWGLDTYDTEDRLKEIHGEDIEVACIGLAGEKLSNIASIVTDKGRIFARSALGAVMGSKKLKAIVAKGEIPILLANKKKMKDLRKKYMLQLEDAKRGLGKYGTATFMASALMEGDAPVKNWSSSSEADFSNIESINGEILLKYQEKKYGCQGCPISCGGYVRVKSGKYKTKELVHKIQYESLGLLGSNLLNDNIESLIYINDICNRYGMDTIGCGGLIAFTIECYERGIIKKIDIDNLDLNWGNIDAIVSLVKKIGVREGIGSILADGFETSIKAFGSKAAEYAMAIRGEGLPAHDPRWSAGLATTYYTDATPSRHTQGSETFAPGGYKVPEFEQTKMNGRGKAHKDCVNLYHSLSCAGLCLFGFIYVDYKSLPEFLEAATGQNYSQEEIFKIGHRIATLRHLFNLREGINLKEANFPKRALGEPPLKSGPTKGITLDLNILVKEYLEENGWDPQTTVPKYETLKNLGIEKFNLQ